MIYSRSDVASVNIGPAHGGCGQVHQRPVDAAGEPVQQWALACSGGCEQHLRSDPCWSVTVMEVPLTPDEAREAEHLKTRVGTDRDQIMLAALAKIAGLPLPDSVARGLPAAAPVTALLACPSCSSAQASGNAFCGSCGSPMRVAAPAPAITGGVS